MNNRNHIAYSSLLLWQLRAYFMCYQFQNQSWKEEREGGRATVNLGRLKIIAEYIYDTSVLMMGPNVVFTSITSSHFC